MEEENMKIQVIGSGCQTCKKLYELTKEAVMLLGRGDKVDYVTDVSKIIELGIMSSPVLTVNGRPVLVGSVPDVDRIKDLLIEGMEAKGQCCEGCTCGGNC